MKIHISGVCGTATASLAGLLKAKGHVVTGSDQDVYPPMSDELAKMGVPVSSPYAEANVPADVDLVVIGNALSRGNPEVEVVLDTKRRYTSPKTSPRHTSRSTSSTATTLGYRFLRLRTRSASSATYTSVCNRSTTGWGPTFQGNGGRRNAALRL